MACHGGFTILELILVVGITIVFAVITLPYLFGSRGKTQLDLTVSQMESMLREAQSRSVSQASSSGWGMRFENATGTAPSFKLFTSPYSSSSVVASYRLPAVLRYATSTLPLGAIQEISFSQLTGVASASTSLTIFLSTDQRVSSTIRIASSGAVSH